NPALIIWVLEDCFNIPEISYFYEVYTKLEKALHKDGFDSSFQHRYLIIDPRTDSTDFLKSFESLYAHYLHHSIHLSTETCKEEAMVRVSFLFRFLSSKRPVKNKVDLDRGGSQSVSGGSQLKSVSDKTTAKPTL
ncbi:unnamed protein product, partial [Arabidopsis halleri]